MSLQDRLSSSLQTGELMHCLERASRLPGHRVYMLDSEMRVMSDIEAATNKAALLIDIKDLTAAFDANISKLDSQKQEFYKKTLNFYNKIFNLSLPVTVNKEELTTFKEEELITVNEEELKNTAEIQGFGYKKANLDQISRLCEESFGPYNICVPGYVGISSSEIQKYLHSCGVDIPLEWQRIIQRHFPSQEERNQLFLTKKYPDEFLLDCSLLRQKIRNSFENFRDAPSDIRLDDVFNTQNLDDLLVRTGKNGERLMVRSTGKEDTKELANAGGNSSIPNVVPDASSVSIALSEVIESYFGEKSLKQRLGANDISIFDDIPLTPVLIQRMIGERTPESLPKCGVMFTEDCQSKTGRQKETSGITVVQAAYGHNEGVVGSLIPVDTFYLDKNGSIIPIIRPKNFRMMPLQESGKLGLIANDAAVAKKPALSKEALLTLKNFAVRLEQFYSGPMDVEFVIDEKMKTIYVVQARPLVECSFNEASYLPEPEKLPAKDKVKGSTIGAAGGSIRIGKPSQFVVAPTLSKALDSYQENSSPLEIEGIIVGQAAPVTSHWATVFHNEGKPVIHVPELSKIESWMDDPEARILISPQQGIVINLESEAVPQEGEAGGQTLMANGWIDYPAPSLISSIDGYSNEKILTDEVIQSFCPLLKKPNSWEAFAKRAAKYQYADVFEGLRNAKGEELQIHLATLLYKFRYNLNSHSSLLKLDPDQQRRLRALESYACMLAENIAKNGDYLPGDAEYSQKLLPIHFFHALIFAQPSANEVIEGGSLAALVLLELGKENQLASELQQQGIVLSTPYTLTLLRLGSLAFTPEIKEKYTQLLLSLDRNNDIEALENIAHIVIQLGKLNLLSSWLNIAVPRAKDAQQLIDDFHQQSQDWQELAFNREIADSFNPAAFSNPKSFDTQWKVLNDQILAYVSKESFFTAFSEAGTMEKLARIALMNKIIDSFDLSIKELERSGEHSLEKKLELFQKMLQGYLAVAELWNQSLCSQNKQIKERLDKANQIVNKLNLTSEDLSFSKDFDVSSFGSRSGIKSSFMVTSPKTLEDAFSVIHQELLAILSDLSAKTGSEDVPKPPLFSHIIETLGFTQGNLTGIELTPQGANYHYTKPLRDHGVHYQLSFRTDSPQIEFRVKYSAANENKRWDRILQYASILKLAGKFDIGDEAEISDNGVGFVFYLDEKDNLKTLKEIVSTIETASTQIARAPRIRIFQ